jgi:hypothetical protein
MNDAKDIQGLTLVKGVVGLKSQVKIFNKTKPYTHATSAEELDNHADIEN